MKKIFLVFLSIFLLSIQSFSQQAELVDEFANINCEDYLARADALINESKKNPTSKFYVYIYEGREERYNKRKKKMELVFPAKGLAKARIESMKRYITGFRRFQLTNIFFVESGFREDLSVQFWRVPEGIEPPKPTPTLEKMKYRKGKATGFCLGCCE